MLFYAGILLYGILNAQSGKREDDNLTIFQWYNIMQPIVAHEKNTSLIKRKEQLIRGRKVTIVGDISMKEHVTALTINQMSIRLSRIIIVNCRWNKLHLVIA